MEPATTQNAVDSATEAQPLWVAFVIRMGGELVITSASLGTLPVYGEDAAGELAVEMTEAFEGEADWRDMRVLCAVYFGRNVPTGDLSEHFLRHETLTNHPEAVGVFLPGIFGTSFAEGTIEA